MFTSEGRVYARAALVAAAICAFCLLAVPRADAAQFLTDPSFEGSNPATRLSPYWATTADRPGRPSPLCDASCYAASYPPKHTGDWMVWFGGWGEGGDGIQSNGSSISQTVTTPAVTGAQLHAWFYKESFSQPSSALEFKVDGNVLLRIDASNVVNYPNNGHYNEIVLNAGNLSAGSHTVRLDYYEMHDPDEFDPPAEDHAYPSNWWIDDVTLTGTPTGIPPAPTLTSTNPASGAANIHPKVIGSAQAGSTVKLYGNATCTGDVLGTGTAGELGVGITATVGHNTTTPFHATAENENGTSACSTSTVTYVEASVPAAPILNGYPPAGANENHPRARGTTVDDSIVKIYKGGTCDGEPVAQGTTDEFEGAGIQFNVLNNTTTTIRAKVFNDGGVSPCSTSRTYKEVTPVPASPYFWKIDPPSGSDDNHPFLHGDWTDPVSPWGGTARIYATPDCTGPVAAEGTAEDFVAPGLQVTVPDNSTTTFSANLTQPLDYEFWAGTSACSTAPIVYTEVSPGQGGGDPDPAPPGGDQGPPGNTPVTPVDNSAARAAALKKCKKKKGKKKQKKCKKKARAAYP